MLFHAICTCKRRDVDKGQVQDAVILIPVLGLRVLFLALVTRSLIKSLFSAINKVQQPLRLFLDEWNNVGRYLLI